MNTRNLADKITWGMVLIACLAMSTWSLYYIARHLGAPIIVAACVSTVFDGAAIKSAQLAMRYARIGESGFGPRLGVIVFAGLSAYINSQHAGIAHNPAFGRLLWASPPIIAVFVYEWETRWKRRKALKNAGRVAAPMPVFGRWSWILFPADTYRDARDIVNYRRALVRAVYAPGTSGPGPETSGPGPETLPPAPDTLILPGQTSQIPPHSWRILPPGGAPTDAEVRAWARDQGIKVTERGPVGYALTEQYLQARAAGYLPGQSGTGVSPEVSGVSGVAGEVSGTPAEPASPRPRHVRLVGSDDAGETSGNTGREDSA